MEIIKVKTGAYLGTHEWMMKEYGSWEDHNESSDHVCAILQKEMDKPFMELTQSEANTLLSSITYQLNAGWDDFESHQEELAIKSCWRGYLNRLTKATQ